MDHIESIKSHLRYSTMTDTETQDVFVCLESDVLALSKKNTEIVISNKNKQFVSNVNEAIIFTVGNCNNGGADVIVLCGPTPRMKCSPEMLRQYAKDALDTLNGISSQNIELHDECEFTTFQGRIYSEQTDRCFHLIPQRVFNMICGYYKDHFNYFVFVPIGYEM